ncbi:MAG: hypothetical protein PVF07_07775 [Thiogranum sp.]|jgi:hypothetical protein
MSDFGFIIGSVAVDTDRCLSPAADGVGSVRFHTAVCRNAEFGYR